MAQMLLFLPSGIVRLNYNMSGKRKYLINENVFSIWSEDMAWLFGYILADGYIVLIKGKTKITRYILGIGSIDKSLVEKTKRIFKTNKPIYIQNKKGKKTFYSLIICSKKIVKDLQKLGVEERKSLRMVFPKVPDEFLKPFIIGYLDGDGAIWRKGSGLQKGELCMDFVGTKSFLSELKSRIIKHTNIKTNSKIYKHSSIYKLKFFHHASKKLSHWLFSDNDMGLNRKRKISGWEL